MKPLTKCSAPQILTNPPPLSMSNHHSHLNQGARKPRPRNDLYSHTAPNRHAAKIPLMYFVSPNSSATQARSPTAQNILRSFQLGDPSPSFARKSTAQSCGNESHMAKTGIPIQGVVLEERRRLLLGEGNLYPRLT
jgi:hypothetical protein